MKTETPRRSDRRPWLACLHGLRLPVLALADQGSVSGANFLLNTALARSLDVDLYGSFATAFVCGLFAAVIHAGALLDPIAIVGPAQRGCVDAPYIGQQLRQHVYITVRLAILPLAAGLLIVTLTNQHALGVAFLASSATMPVVLLLPFARRLLFVAGRHGLAACAASLYALGISVGIALLGSHGLLNLVSAFVLMGTASLTGSAAVLLAYEWRQIWHHAFAPACVDQRQHLQARSLVPAAAMTFAVTQIQVPAITMLLGTAQAGIYRAMQLPMVAVGQVITAAAVLALPRIAQSFAHADYSRLRRQTRQLWLGLLVVCVVVEVCLLVGYEHISMLLYGAKFAEVSWLMPILGLVAVVSSSGTTAGTVLRATQQSSTQLRAAAITAVVGVPLALALTATGGVTGAAWSAVINYFVLSSLNIQLYRRVRSAEGVPVSGATVHGAA